MKLMKLNEGNDFIEDAIVVDPIKPFNIGGENLLITPD
jgi:hypothetical protein